MSLQDDLRALFVLDKQVRGLRSRLDATLRREKLMGGKLEQLQQQHHELTDHLRHVQARTADLEGQSESLDERITKQRDQMNTVKTNKEYSALLVEVNTLKLEKGKLEEQTLEEMGKIDELKEEVAAIEEKIEEQKKLVEGAGSDVQAARDAVGDKLDEVQAERDRAAEAIPESALKTFEKLADDYDGEAMAAIVEQDRKRMEYTCDGCFTILPFECVNAAITRADDVVLCPNCDRILYMDKELKADLSTK